jgi:hypothetical protein
LLSPALDVCAAFAEGERKPVLVLGAGVLVGETVFVIVGGIDVGVLVGGKTVLVGVLVGGKTVLVGVLVGGSAVLVGVVVEGSAVLVGVLVGGKTVLVGISPPLFVQDLIY